MVKNMSMKELIEKNYDKVNKVFLGIGLTLFVMNITAYVSFVRSINYPQGFFNIAIFSSMIIVLISVYYINEKH